MSFPNQKFARCLGPRHQIGCSVLVKFVVGLRNESKSSKHSPKRVFHCWSGQSCPHSGQIWNQNPIFFFKRGPHAFWSSPCTAFKGSKLLRRRVLVTFFGSETTLSCVMPQKGESCLPLTLLSLILPVSRFHRPTYDCSCWCLRLHRLSLSLSLSFSFFVLSGFADLSVVVPAVVLLLLFNALTTNPCRVCSHRDPRWFCRLSPLVCDRTDPLSAEQRCFYLGQCRYSSCPFVLSLIFIFIRQRTNGGLYCPNQYGSN